MTVSGSFDIEKGSFQDCTGRGIYTVYQTVSKTHVEVLGNYVHDFPFLLSHITNIIQS